MNKPKGLQVLAAAVVLASLTAAFGAFAASVLPVDLDDMTAGAQHIVHVRCTSNEVQRDAAVGVATVSTFVVLDRAKGTGTATFAVRQPGGMLDGVAIDYHVPKFAVGGEYVLFMPPASPLGLASPVGLSQGAFAVTHGKAGKEVGNGSDFAMLLPAAARAGAPPGLAARLEGAPSERTRVDLADFMSVIRAKVGAK